MIVGSAALKFHGASGKIDRAFILREPRDVDLWVAESFREKDKVYPYREVYGLHYETHILPDNIINLIPHINHIALPDAIYTIKCSHAGWDIHWQKTMNDIMALRKLGCKKIPELYDALYKYWLVHHSDKKYLSLNKTKKEFFTDYVTYVIDHDKLHEIVAGDKPPMYTKVLKEGCEVLVDKSKFDKLSENEKLNLFLEEICVIALERWVIPSRFEYSKRKAYQNALKKTIVSLTKNWATEFIVDNYEYYAKNTNWDWFNRAELELGDKNV